MGIAIRFATRIHTPSHLRQSWGRGLDQSCTLILDNNAKYSLLQGIDVAEGGESMSEETDVVRGIRQFVSFILAGEEYGIPILQVREIIRYTSLTRVPRSAAFIEGVLNLRGQVIPVINLRKRFGLPAIEHTSSSRIVVVEVQQQTVGVTVDSVNAVRGIDESQIDPPPPMGTQIDTEFISGMGKLDDRLIILLNLDRAFSTEEKELM